MQDVMIGTLQIAYQLVGEGPPLVLLHGGFGLSSTVWSHQLAGLADEFTVVAWDMPGCGKSTDPPEAFRASDYAECLAEFIEALGLERPCLLGHSFGGALALEYYLRHPSVPSALILASATAGWAGSLPAEIVEQRKAQVSRALDLPADQWAREWSASMVSLSASADLQEEIVGYLSDFHVAGQRTLIHAFADLDRRDVLPHISVPTMLLYGDVDVRTPLNVAEDLYHQIPGAHLVVIPGVGHLSNVEAPERFNREVRQFLRSTNPE